MVGMSIYNQIEVPPLSRNLFLVPSWAFSCVEVAHSSPILAWHIVLGQQQLKTTMPSVGWRKVTRAWLKQEEQSWNKYLQAKLRTKRFLLSGHFSRRTRKTVRTNSSGMRRNGDKYRLEISDQARDHYHNLYTPRAWWGGEDAVCRHAMLQIVNFKKKAACSWVSMKTCHQKTLQSVSQPQTYMSVNARH